ELAARGGRGGRQLARGGRLELQLIPLAPDADARAARELTAEDELRERVFQQALDGALERSGAERRVEAALDEEFDRLRNDLEVDLLRVQTLLELAGEDIHDLAHVLARQGVEHDHVVDAVQELGIEGPLELVMDRGLDRAELLHAALGLREAEAA